MSLWRSLGHSPGLRQRPMTGFSSEGVFDATAWYRRHPLELKKMKLCEAVLIALRAHRLRSALTMLGLIVGVASVILLVGRRGPAS